MAECPKLAAEIAALKAEQDAGRKIERALIGEASALKEAPTGKFRTFSMADGTKVRVNPMEFWKEVERTMVGMGEEEVRKLVQANFDNKVKGVGSKGLNINYGEMEFGEEQLYSLLEVMGAYRRKSKGGQELMMPFTKQVAQDQVAAQISLRGGNVEEIARGLSRKQSFYKDLPLDMVMSKLMRQDSAAYLADQLDDYAELLGTIGVSAENKRRIARSAQYAYFFEQLDATLARKVGQALQARQLNSSVFDFSLENVLENMNYEDVRLDMNKVSENSLASQILEAIESENAPALKRIATLKRLNQTKDITLNRPEVFTQIEILNSYRKANLFASPATWIQRNVVSGALVNGSYMMEDVWEGVYRVGVGDGFKAAQYAGAQTIQGMTAAFANAFEVFTSGQASYTKTGLIEGVDAGSLVYRKDKAYGDLNAAWDRVFGKDGKDNGLSNGVAVMTWFNAGARVFTGEIVEKLSKGNSSAGYSPVFTALAAGDEVNRKMAFDWKVSHESYLRATKEWNETFDIGDTTPNKAEWIANRANQMAEKAVFKGIMTDDELVKVRRQLGMDQYGSMDNEALRLKIFNEQNGLPDPSNDIAAMGINRGSDVTFTQPLKDLVSGGMQMIRRQPVAGYVVPIWQTPVNGLKWIASRDLIVNIADSVARESVQSFAKLKQGGVKALLPGADVSDLDLPMTPEAIAKGRARATQAVAIAAITQGLWETGVFSDGGPFNPDNRTREAKQIPPYSFSIGVNGIVALSKINIPGISIDLVDLMGLQADVMRAFSEGILNHPDFSRFMDGITQAYARAIDSKQSLRGVISLFEFMTGRAKGNEAKWGTQIRTQMNGLIPYSGILTAASRGFQDENMMAVTERRHFTPQEIAVMKEDPNNNLFEDVAQTIAKNIPLLGMPGAKFRNRDWMGRERKKPFGLPIDAVMPFAPMLVRDNPLDAWLLKHGLGSVPKESGRLQIPIPEGDGRGGAMMSLEEEDDFREGMWSTVGSVPAEVVLGEKNAFVETGLGPIFNINDYVQGNTLEQALTALSLDPNYNAVLNTPGSVSLTQHMDKPYSQQSLAKRRGKMEDAANDFNNTYKVYNAVVEYYVRAGTEVMLNKHPQFMEKAMANERAAYNAWLKQQQTEAPFGLSRQ